MDGQEPNMNSAANTDTQGQTPNTEAPSDNTVSQSTDVQRVDTQNEQKFDAAYVKQLRDEAAKYRKLLRESEAKVQQSQQSQMTDAERAAQRLKELETANTTLQQQLRTAAVERAVQASKIVGDKALALRLIDQASLEFDDDGQPANVDQLLRALVREFPALLPGASAAGMNATNGNTAQNGKPVTYTRSQLADPKFYREHKADIMRAAREGRISDG